MWQHAAPPSIPRGVINSAVAVEVRLYAQAKQQYYVCHARPRYAIADADRWRREEAAVKAQAEKGERRAMSAGGTMPAQRARCAAPNDRRSRHASRVSHAPWRPTKAPARQAMPHSSIRLLSMEGRRASALRRRGRRPMDRSVKAIASVLRRRRRVPPLSTPRR